MPQPVPSIAVVVVAGGSGTRLGEDVPKAFVGIDAKTMLRHALDGVFRSGLDAQVVVVAPADRTGEALTEALAAAGDARERVSVVSGGDTRQKSVAAGLAALWGDVEIVLVHDAARALTPPEVFTRIVAAVERTGWGAVPVLPVVDTIKRVDGDEIIGVVDRSELGAAQTPQGFRRDVLSAAYAVADSEFTDDAALVAAAGHRIAAVAGDALGFKITHPADLERARALLTPATEHPVHLQQPAPAPRVGVGTDVHAFAGDGELWLAGLRWPGEPSLSGHSDGGMRSPTRSSTPCWRRRASATSVRTSASTAPSTRTRTPMRSSHAPAPWWARQGG
ncbi:2-C-methyl-D-erythritol 4-phosphate cytidylyltransferase/2-C-methyl-D-erythritol 2,4-cyclodiphosphate synthase [Microbacterium sp. SORGH_AS428]|nr:2-C-methyl-D-erythritol 4-phosphate cytidylyltransferase/2-C-methyl-D-erythritol 2,4-cyclodiphosphate synthase [Microbacterium sp. SORGH_AS_0428]